ncbi:MipA/OmpV family protein [Pseudoalteromonas sp. SSDWG2]|uniref:MipA/OmpV family protein n=1 Tax=Pseudoalteromonas sp. SSDWG2 TaxID=3139391 RepID=UPI003BA9D174
MNLFALATILTSMSVKSTQSDYIYQPSNSWVLGAAFGYGKLASPLKGRQEIPLYILPDVRYYGERFSLDNLNASYALIEKKGWVVELIGSQNFDGVYFPGKHRQEYGAFAGSFSGSFYDLLTPRPAAPAHRSMSYLGGVETRFYDSQWVNVYISWQKDVSNVHHGSETKLRLLKNISLQPFQVSLEGRLTYKSDALSRYYFSVREGDIVSGDHHYQASATLDWLLGVNVAYPMSEQLAAVASFQQQWFGGGVNDSPLLRTTAPYSFFVGIKYVL